MPVCFKQGQFNYYSSDSNMALHVSGNMKDEVPGTTSS